MRGGWLTLGRWRGAPVRAHWTLPIGALVFGQGRVVPGFWLGYFLLVLVHELGHAILVRRFRRRVVSIDIHALGGVCRWSGGASAIERAWIAWGGVLAEAVVLAATYVALALAGPPDSLFLAQLVVAFTTGNLWLIALNLMPVPPLDGAEAWKLPGLLLRRRKARRAEGAPSAGAFEYERQVATLDRYSEEPDEAVKAAVSDVLERLRGDKPTPRD